MTTYTATYRTALTFSEHEFEAASAEAALALAQAFHQANPLALNWEHYHFDAREPLEEIEIEAEGEGDSTLWQDESVRLAHAADDLLDAVEQAVQALNTAPRFPVPGLDTDSYQIAALCDRAILKAKGGVK